MSLVLEVDGRFQTENQPHRGRKELAKHLVMQKSVYTHTCIDPAWNPSYSRSLPIRHVAGSWKRSGRASAPCTCSWKPWTSSNRASRGTSASFMKQGSCACERRGKKAPSPFGRGRFPGWEKWRGKNPARGGAPPPRSGRGGND